MAASLSSANQLDSAIVIARSALKKAESQFGQSDTAVARVLHMLGDYNFRRGNVAESERFYRRAYTIRKDALGPDDIDVARSLSGQLSTQGLLYAEQTRYSEAERLLQRSLTIKKRAYGSKHFEVGRSLMHLGNLYGTKGNYDEAEGYYKRALAIWEQAEGPMDNFKAMALYNSAGGYLAQGKYVQAEAFFTRALDIWERIFGPEDKFVATVLDRVALVNEILTKYAEAEQLLKRALTIREKNFGYDHVNVGYSLVALASLYQGQSKFAEAEQYYKRSIAIFKKQFGPEHPRVAMISMYLSIVSRKQGKHVEADSLFKMFASITQKPTDPGDRDLETPFHNIAGGFHEDGRYAEAELMYERVLHILEHHEDPDYPHIAVILNGLADAYTKQGKYAEAEPLYGRAFTILKKAGRAEHPDLAYNLESSSRYHRTVNNATKSLSEAAMTFRIRQKNFEDAFTVLSEREALSYALDMRKAASNYLSSYFDSNVSDDFTSRSAADVVFSSKGHVSDGVLERRKMIVTEKDSATVALFEAYRHAKFQITQSYVEGPGESNISDYTTRIDSLRRLANDLESDLARQSARFNRTRDYQNVTAERLASLLPSNSTLVEYLKYEYLQLSPDTAIAHYLVAVLDAGRNLHIKDLGDAGEIDKWVNDYRRHFLGRAESRQPLTNEEHAEYTSISSQLYRIMWQPVESYINTNGTVLIAPDGGLNLVSFAGLIDDEGMYLIERHAIHYLSAGRDLIRLKDRFKSGSGFIAFGNPDYDAPVSTRQVTEPEFALNPAIKADPYAVRNVRSGCGTLSELSVGPLYHTGAEVEAVARLWVDNYQSEPSIVYVGPAASEERFKNNTSRRRVIHLATHGYFLQGECEPQQPMRDFWTETIYPSQNPLLLSGLLLAGANLHGEGAEEAGAEDGIVTGLEVSEMDLRGTDLVVLSACETGLGEVKQGEGVYGLRRAFQMAGARTVVSALWQVPDVETMKIMKELYSQKATTYPELMQRVALSRIKELRLRGRPTHPYSWGAFIATGDWRMR